MMTDFRITIVLGIVLALLLCIDILLIMFATHMGLGGHRNVLAQNIIGVFIGFCFAGLAFVWFEAASDDSRFWCFAIFFIGLFISLPSIYNLRNTLRESSKDLVTDVLTDVVVTPTGYCNMAIKLSGCATDRNVWFIVRGVDKKIAKEITKSNINVVTIAYHSKTRRIESISF